MIQPLTNHDGHITPSLASSMVPKSASWLKMRFPTMMQISDLETFWNDSDSVTLSDDANNHGDDVDEHSLSFGGLLTRNITKTSKNFAVVNNLPTTVKEVMHWNRKIDLFRCKQS